ncbi:MAG: tetratricopeptide repeat protein [Flavobacterium sp.]|uniref:tetratricopeptide repeat protein n=1 Tax=Flavobacterium sp. TaxID=239 RepID=UPI0012246A20|nr:tetratricopeptide repeat protein [Flavobacterium sp.]RZJ68111.1 MAG: tetratricopeptide repeat protein [Flavobacterium sp.]
MKNAITFALILCCAIVSAQEEVKEEKDKFLPEGNNAFEKKDYLEAEADYRVSQSKFRKKAISSYNLGNSIYAMKHPSEAKYAYGNAIKNATTRPEKHKAYHNLGNALMQEKDYQNAVQAFKNALINNPSDEETRYNYALAKQKLKENPPPPPKKNDKDKNKDKQDKKDDKGGDKDKKQNDKQDEKEKDNKDKGQNKQDGGDQKQPEQKPQPKPGSGISGQRMDNLLDAVNNEEKKVQDKVKARQVKGKPVQTEKDW